MRWFNPRLFWKVGHVSHPFLQCLAIPLLPLAFIAVAGQGNDEARRLIGWGWENLPHGQTLASDVLGQFVEGDPSRPHFGSYGPYGGARPHGFFFFAFNAGRYQRPGGMDAHLGIGKLAVPDYWNQRVLLFDLHPDGSLKSRAATGLIGQKRFDVMEIGQGPDHFHYPSEVAFDPTGKFLFVVDEYNHRVLQFDLASPDRAVRVYGQPDFEQWGPDSSPGHLMWNSTRLDVRGPRELVRKPNNKGFFLPRGVATDGGRLFVSDSDNHRVLVFETTGTENGPAATAVLGQADFTGYLPNRGGPRGPGTMLFPAGLSLARDGKLLLVADGMHERLLVFDVSGEIENGQPAIIVLPLLRADPPQPQPEEKKLEGALSVAVDRNERVYLTDQKGPRVLVYDLDSVLDGKTEPIAAIGKFEMMTDLDQSKGKGGYVGPFGLAAAGDFLYVLEPRGNRVLCYDARNPSHLAVDLLGQFYGEDLSRPNYNKYGNNNGPDPYGFDFADGIPAVSVSEDGHWLLVSDAIGGRLMFFPLGPDGLTLDRSARFMLGVKNLSARGNSYGADRFNRPSFSLLTDEGRLFASDFQGSRILYFELPNLMAGYGEDALAPVREYVPPTDRAPRYREEGLFLSIDSGIPASAVLGQKDFMTGLRGVATARQMGKEMSGASRDRERNWLFIAEKLNNRVLVVDVSGDVTTFMPAMAVLGQSDFTSNEPTVFHEDGAWNPAGMSHPSGVCYDNRNRILFVTHGEGRDREILGFDLSEGVTSGMAPILRIGGPRSTVETDLDRISFPLAIDEKRGRLYTGLIALDISGNVRERVPVLGWFGMGPHPDANRYEDSNSGSVPSLLGYSVAHCHRFGGAVTTTAVNPYTGTVYVADNSRYRVLCFQPDFAFNQEPLTITIGEESIGILGTGGLAPLEFSIKRGSLPEGLEMDPATGIFSGVALGEPGESTLEVKVKTAIQETSGFVRIVLARKK